MYDYSKRPAICMKVGVSAMLRAGKKETLPYAPIAKDGKVYVPAAVASGSVCVIDGKDYVDIENISGAFVKYDTMGLIIIDGCDDILAINRKDDTKFMLTLMNEFIFDVERVKMAIGAYAPATDEERAGFKRVGADILARVRATGAKHPYIHTDAQKLARLRAIYEGEDCLLKEYIGKIVAHAEKLLEDDNCKLNDAGDGLVSPPVNTFPYDDGYDVGGRQGASESHLSRTLPLALAYHITGKQEFAKSAYYICVAVGNWEHWGPGHFLNCAGASGNMAVAYDWLYNAWRELKLDTGVVKRAIFKNGIYEGWRSVIEDNCTYPSKKQGTGWRFKNKTDNWNSVNNASLLISNLALLSEDADEDISEDDFAKIIELAGANVSSMFQDGLMLKQYAPDGSYVESNSYWSYGTSRLFQAMGAMKTAMGTDLGFHHAAGMDRTCYYAINTESAEYVGWNYHDGALHGQDTTCFNMFAYVSGDYNLFAIRRNQLERGKSVSMFDLLYNPELLGITPPALDALPLDYYMEGIDAMTVRNGWTTGSIFAGMIGGENPSGGSHNQIDSGAFVYHNKGVNWFCDLGSDYYNITGGYFGNPHLYRRNAEGNNCLAVKAFPYGQRTGGVGRVIEETAGAENPYLIIDNAEVYEGVVKSAYRGMLMTADRKTVVFQDEVEFNSPSTAWWTGHFKSSEITATVSEDGKCVTLTHKDGASVNVKLIGGERFEITSCYDFLLDGTATFEGEYDRKELSRLVVAFKDVTSIKCAIVIEDNTDSYTAITPMAEWKKLNA